MFNPDQLHHIARAASNRQKGAVVLENVEKEEALEIFKLCDTFGIQQVHMIFDKISKYNPAAITDGDGFYNAARWVDAQECGSADKCLSKLKEDDYKIILPIFGKGGTDIYSATLKEEKTAVVIGGAKHGISETAEGFADVKISIKRGGVTEKLSAPLIAGIFLYELTRQRVLYGMDNYLLPIEKEDEIRRRFSKE